MTGFWVVGALACGGVIANVVAPARIGHSRGFLAVVSLLLSLLLLAFFRLGGDPVAAAPFDRRLAQWRDGDPLLLGGAERLAVLQSVVRERPDDAEAWGFYAWQLSDVGRHFEAVQARERVVELRPDAESFSSLGRALVALNDAVVTPEAQAAFDAALERAPQNVEARWFRGLAALQNDDAGAAAHEWGELLAEMDESDPRRAEIATDVLNRLSTVRRNPDVFAEALDTSDASSMAGGMLAQLESRLAERPNDLPGWLMLARGRAVMGDRDAAVAALEAALTIYAHDPAGLALLTAAQDFIVPAANRVDGAESG